MSTVQKWARLEKEYLHSDSTSDTNIRMTGGQGGDLSVRKRILICFQFLTKLKTVKNGYQTVPSFLVLLGPGTHAQFWIFVPAYVYEFIQIPGYIIF